jgi:hypothetical protein
MAFTMVTITSSLDDPEGNPANGTATVKLTETLVNGTEVVPAGSVQAVITNGQLLKPDGQGAFELAATDDVGTQPEGAEYEWVILLDGNAEPIAFTEPLPHSPSTVDLSTWL